MRLLIVLIAATLFFSSCKGKAETAKAFCDTTCSSDSLNFDGKNKFNPRVSISMKNCRPDTLSWTHEMLGALRSVELPSFLNQDVRINKSAISCVIQDTTMAWLTFNDCITGRGYLLKLPFNKKKEISKITGALNSFDPKFSVESDLRAYTDRGSIFVVDINTGKEATMTFKEVYDIDFNKIHEIVDTINITHKRIYAKLLKNGQEVPFEKQIDL